MKKFHLLTAVLLVVLFSCTSPKKVMNSWVGDSRQNLIFKWGPPVQTASDGRGGEILTYAQRVYSEVGGTIVDYWDYRLFYVNSKDIVYHWMMRRSPNPPTTVNVRVLGQ